MLIFSKYYWNNTNNCNNHANLTGEHATLANVGTRLSINLLECCKTNRMLQFTWALANVFEVHTRLRFLTADKNW